MPESAVTTSTASNHPAPLRLEVTSDTAVLKESRRQAEAFVAAAGFDAKAAADVGLAINEAMANVIRHAYSNARGLPIVVTLGLVPGDDCRGRTLRVTIQDWGNGINPDAQPRCRPDPSVPGGLGLICLRSIMDDVVFTPQPKGMLLTMTKKAR